jgi:hypothetical protein
MEGNGKHRYRRVSQQAVPPEVSRRPGVEVQRSVLGFDSVWFTRHALQRMKQRGVSEAEVFLVLEHPTKKGLRTQSGRERWRRNRTEVVFERWSDKRLCIVTVIVI